MQHSNIPSKQNNWRKEYCVRFGDFSSEIPYNYHSRSKKILINPQNYFSKLCSFFKSVLTSFIHMFMCTKKTLTHNKNCCLNKTGEGNMVVNLAISAWKCLDLSDGVYGQYMRAISCKALYLNIVPISKYCYLTNIFDICEYFSSYNLFY